MCPKRMTRWGMTWQEEAYRCLNATGSSLVMQWWYTGDAVMMLHKAPVRTAELVSRSLNKAGAETQHNFVLVHQLVEVLLRRLRHLLHNRSWRNSTLCVALLGTSIRSPF